MCFLTILSARPVLTRFAARRLSSRPVTQWSSRSSSWSSRSSSSSSSSSSKAVVGMSEPLAKKLKEGPDALYAERTVQRLAPLSVSVHPKRVRTLKKAPQGSSGPVLYWMSREQRVEDNWALLYAVEQAREQSAQVAVVFNLVPEFMNAGARQFVFMLEGLSALERVLARKNIPFFLTQGDPVKEIPALVNSVMASTLVTDMSP
ncbi:MAG: deoxyribodipyrimidine photo-lyase, partial [bacterium]